MIFPSINDLSQGKYNRYEIALATAKCARRITNEYVRQRTEAERAITGNKETDRPLNAMIDRELRDEKAVNVAINRIYDGEYVITHKSPEEQEKEEQAILEGLQSYEREDEDFDLRAEDGENRLPVGEAGDTASEAADMAEEAGEDVPEDGDEPEEEADGEPEPEDQPDDTLEDADTAPDSQ